MESIVMNLAQMRAPKALDIYIYRDMCIAEKLEQTTTA